MKRTRLGTFLFIAVAMILGMFWSREARAAGIIATETPAVAGERINIGIKQHSVYVEIKDGLAATRVNQVFENRSNSRIEGTYFFPLPKGAGISDFSLRVDGKKVQGEMLKAQEARKIYDDIVRKTRDPALLEYADQDVYRLRIFPFEAHSEKRVEIQYTQVLAGDFGLYQYLFPFRASQFSLGPIKDAAFKVVITSSNSSIKSIYSSSHDVKITRKDARRTVVSYTGANESPNRDFSLYWSIGRETVGASVVTCRDAFGGDDFFLLMLNPGLVDKDDKVVPKDVNLVFDISGSMSGEKIEQAKQAMKFIVNTLNKDDRFNIITFQTVVSKWKDKLAPVTRDNKAEAMAFISRMNAGGMTNLNEAALTAVKTISNTDRPAYIIFVTDGIPTQGVTDPETILANVRKEEKGRIRMFTFGVGFDVNFQLLDRLSGENGGLSSYVKPSEDMEAKISNFYARIQAPVLADASLRFQGVKPYAMHPDKIGDLFAGQQVIIVGRYQGKGDATIFLEGKSSSKKITLRFPVRFPSRVTDDSVALLWANRRIGYLMDQIRLHGQNQELVDEIVKLAQLYGIVTPYTSFLITDEQIASSKEEYDRKMVDAKSLAQDKLKDTNTVQTGSAAYDNFAAVQNAAQANQYQGYVGYKAGAAGAPAAPMAAEMQPAAAMVQNVGQNVYLQRGDVWVAANYQGQELKKIVFLSDEYKQLLQDHPEVAGQLSISSNLILQVGDKWVQVTPN